MKLKVNRMYIQGQDIFPPPTQNVGVQAGSKTPAKIGLTNKMCKIVMTDAVALNFSVQTVF